LFCVEEAGAPKNPVDPNAFVLGERFANADAAC
jgi:hypothetical protein